MAKIQLPARVRADAAWDAVPPDPLDDPDLYDGLMWRRPMAFFLDVVIIGAAAFVLWIVLTILTVMSFGLLLPVKVAALALLPFAYHTYFIGQDGATLGMRFFDVEVRTWTGGQPDFLQAFLMTVAFYLTVTPSTCLILAVALFNDRRRTLHDFLSGTVVVRHTRVLVTGMDAIEASYSEIGR